MLRLRLHWFDYFLCIRCGFVPLQVVQQIELMEFEPQSVDARNWNVMSVGRWAILVK